MYQAGFISILLFGSIVMPIALTRLLLWLSQFLHNPLQRIILVHGFVLLLYIIKLIAVAIIHGDSDRLLLSLLSCMICLSMFAYDFIATKPAPD